MTSLPFLYPRMVRPLRRAVVRQFLRAYSESSSSASQSTPTSTTRSTTSTKAPRLRVRRDPIPFELPPDMEGEVEPEERIEGTITPIERQAFTKIFHDISRSIPEVSSSAGSAARRDPAEIVQDASSEQVRAREPVRSERRGALEEARASISVLGRLDKIDDVDAEIPFAEAAGAETTAGSAAAAAAASAESAARRRALAEFPPSLRSAASDAIGSRERKRLSIEQQLHEQALQQEEEEEEDPAMVAAAKKAADTEQLRQKRQEKMERVMLSMRTDAALWEYMEECVFSMVDEFGLAAQGAAAASAKDKASREKGRKLGPVQAAQSLRKRPSSTLLTYGPVYPAALLHGLRLLGGHFSGGATSPLALAVLPRIKSLGLQSYVLGAGTPLYNELLKLQWTRLGDAVAVFALLQEMQQAGLAFNDGTLAVLKSMEFHLQHLQHRPGQAHKGIVDLDSVHRPLGTGTGKGTAFVGAALQHLPDVAAVPSMVAWWRKQVEAGAINSRRYA